MARRVPQSNGLDLTITSKNCEGAVNPLEPLEHGADRAGDARRPQRNSLRPPGATSSALEAQGQPNQRHLLIDAMTRSRRSVPGSTSVPNRRRIRLRRMTVRPSGWVNGGSVSISAPDQLASPASLSPVCGMQFVEV